MKIKPFRTQKKLVIFKNLRRQFDTLNKHTQNLKNNYNNKTLQHTDLQIINLKIEIITI